MILKKKYESVIINLLLEWVIIEIGGRMVLNVWESIKNFFVNIHWNNIIILLTGVILGFFICGILYLIILLNSIRKANKNDQKQNYTEDIIKTSEVNEIILKAKEQYKIDKKKSSIALKMDLVKSISWNLINDISKVYYPDSKYPVYELSLDELIKLSYYITERVDNIFNGNILKHARKFKISQLIALIEAKKKMDEKKIVKASKKVHAGKIVKVASAAINFINPAFWVKKIMFSTTLNVGSNKMANIIIQIVGEETAKIYSKHLFYPNNDIEESIKQLENELRGE